MGSSSRVLTDDGHIASSKEVGGLRELPRVRLAKSTRAEAPWPPAHDQFDVWRARLRQTVLAEVADFVSARCADELGDCGVDVAGDILLEFVRGGKCLRSTFMYLGWLCGAPANDAALAATASLELLHAFALLQDDVMDDSPSRRGRPAAHIQFAAWHHARGLSGSSRRFGESAAVLLGDLCLIWAEQMLRGTGLKRHHLDRAWPRYNTMRTELAVGQFGDLAIDLRNLPTMESVLAVARKKSGNYTVRRPLEIGAAMAGCSAHTVEMLGEYGSAIGEAFQLRDDILGIFGSPESTGKPNGGDLQERKATSVVVAAYHMGDASTRRQFGEFINSATLCDDALDRWRSLIVATGAVSFIEQMISDRVEIARKSLSGSGVDPVMQSALTDMAGICTKRAA